MGRTRRFYGYEGKNKAAAYAGSCIVAPLASETMTNDLRAAVYDERLPREIGRVAFAALALNGMIGAGVFGLPSKAFASTGTLSPLLILVCAAIIGLVMLCFARAASFFGNTGGPQLYAGTAFGPFVGFQTGWLLYIGRVTAGAANLNLMATYLGAIWPGADRGLRWLAIVGGACVLLTAINVVGVRLGVGSVLVITVLKLAPLFVLIAVGLAAADPEAYRGAQFPAYTTLGQAVLVFLYAFVGFEGALVPAGEGRDPRRDIPRALFLSLGVTAAIYVLVQIACIALLPSLAESARPLAEAAAAVAGPAGAAAIALTAAVSIIGNGASAMLTAPRMTYGLALEGSLPGVLARVHDRFHTPYVSIVLFGALYFVFATQEQFEGLAAMSSLARVLVYIACIAALPTLERNLASEEGMCRIPGGWTVPAVALVVCLWLVTQASFTALWYMLAFVAAGSVLFAFARRSRRGDPGTSQ